MSCIKREISYKLIIKIVLSLLLVLLFGKIITDNGLDFFVSDYNYKVGNNAYEEDREYICVSDDLTQQFMARGNILKSVTVYFHGVKDAADNHDVVSVNIKDSQGEQIKKVTLEFNEADIDGWYSFDLDDTYLNRGEYYGISVLCDNTTIQLAISDQSDELTFGNLFANDYQLSQTLLLGFDFEYRYITFGRAVCGAAQLILIVIILIILLHTIMKIDHYSNSFVNSKEKHHGVFVAFLTTMITTLAFNPMDECRTSVEIFKRVFGAGFVRDYDTSAVIKNFQLWFFLFAVVFGLTWLFFNFYLERLNISENANISEALNAFKNITVITLVVVFLKVLVYFDNATNYLFFSSYAVGLAVFLWGYSSCYLAMSRLIRCTFKEYMGIFMASFFMSFWIAVCISKDIDNGTLILACHFMLALILNIILLNKSVYDRINCSITLAVIALSFIPIFISAYIELINILNQHYIFIGYPRKYYLILSSLFSLVDVLIIGAINKKKSGEVKNWNTLAYPISIFGLSCLSVQLPLSQVYSADIFESSNFGLLINDFIQFGDIPIVEHYGGHMLQSVWEGLIYAFLNGDVQGAILSPYDVYIWSLLALIFYFCISRVIGRNIAFWVVLLIPFHNYWYTYGVGMLMCLTVLLHVKKRNWFSAFVFSISFVWCSLYRIDLGYAFIFPSIIIFLILFAKDKDVSAISKTIISLLAIGLAGIIAWLGLCFYREIDAVSRLKEFLLISASNQTQGNYGLGDMSKAAFSWTYLILPFIVISCLVVLLIVADIRTKIGTNSWIVLVMLGLGYIFNFQRLITKHSLVEGAGVGMPWCAFVFIGLFVAGFINCKVIFVPIFVGLIYINNLFLTDSTLNLFSMIENDATKLESSVEDWRLDRFSVDSLSTSEYMTGLNPQTKWEIIAGNKEKVRRVTSSLEAETEYYRRVMDMLLDEDETFADFMCRTFVYAAINRRCPLYIAQSPIMLSGEYTQEQYIAEIEKNADKVPIVLMPAEDSRISVAFAGVSNAYRYYKVSEYIYQNYRPLCSFADAALWVRNDRYDEKLDKYLKSFDGIRLSEDEPEIKLIDWGYDAGKPINNDGIEDVEYISQLHNYRIYDLPRIWAEQDINDAKSNEMLEDASFENGCMIFNNISDSRMASSSGNYIVFDAESYLGECDGILKLGSYENGEFTELCRYCFNIEEGKHTYLFRVSTDYYWYIGKVNAAKLDTSDNVRSYGYRILIGD